MLPSLTALGRRGRYHNLLGREEVENDLYLILGDNSRAVEVLRRRCVGMSFLFPSERQIAFGQLIGNFKQTSFIMHVVKDAKTLKLWLRTYPKDQQSAARMWRTALRVSRLEELLAEPLPFKLAAWWRKFSKTNYESGQFWSALVNISFAKITAKGEGWDCREMCRWLFPSFFVHLFDKSAIFSYDSGSTTGMEEKGEAGRGQRRQLAKALRPSSL